MIAVRSGSAVPLSLDVNLSATELLCILRQIYTTIDIIGDSIYLLYAYLSDLT